MNTPTRRVRDIGHRVMIKLAQGLCLTLLLAPPLAAAAPSSTDIPGCQAGALASNDPRYPADQLILTCVPPPGSPAPYNGVLVVYAHGYEFPQAPLALPELDLNGLNAPQVLTQLGFGFATSSFHKNGYAIEQAGNDLNALVAYFKSAIAPVQKVLVVGGSEGGLIATMLVERHPEVYAGGLAMCGPVGGASYQIRYFGDFRVVFDYYFPQVFPDFGVVDVPPSAYLNWPGYALLIRDALLADPGAAKQLARAAHVAIDADNPAAFVDATIDLLAYNVGGFNDLREVAGGNPYGNLLTWYWGSSDDRTLNRGIERVASDRTGRRYLSDYYQPSGRLSRPLVTLHTLSDEIAPFTHELIYALHALLSGSLDRLTVLPVARYGHCNFETVEVLGALALLAQKTGVPLTPALAAYRQSIGGLVSAP